MVSSYTRIDDLDQMGFADFPVDLDLKMVFEILRCEATHRGRC